MNEQDKSKEYILTNLSKASQLLAEARSMTAQYEQEFFVNL